MTKCLTQLYVVMARNNNKRIENAPSVKVICFICAAVLISGAATIGAMNLFGTDLLYVDYSVAFTAQSVVNGIAVLAAAALVFIAVYNVLKLKNAYKYVIGLALVLRIISAFFWKIEPESDFKITYELAKMLSDTSVWQWGETLDNYGTIYNDIWSAHMPFIVYQSFLLRISDSVFTLKIANALFSWISCILCGEIVRKLGTDKGCRAAVCACAINPTAIFFVPVLTNQHISQFLFVLAIWIFFCTRLNICIRVWLSGMCIGLSHLMRPEMQVVIIAVTAFVILCCFKEKTQGKYLCVYAVGIAAFLTVMISANTMLVSSHIVHRNIYSGNLNYKIMVGLNPETNGAWNEADSYLIGDDLRINNLIGERLKNPKLPVMMFGKASYQLGTYVYSWSFGENNYFVSQNVMRRGAAALMMFVCIMSAVKMLRKRRYELIWLYLTLAGYAVAYSLMEVQGRYSYVFIPMLIISAFV